MKRFVIAALLLGSALCFYNGITSVLTKEAYIASKYSGYKVTHVTENGATADGIFNCIFGVGLILVAISVWRDKRW